MGERSWERLVLQGGLLLPLQFVVKQSEGHGYELDEEIWNLKQLCYEGF